LGKLNGYDVCLVTMTGAKTGKQRVIPLMYVPYNEGVIIVASQGGAPRNPVWFNNLVAHPDIEVQYKNKKMKLRARRANA
ncbi:MAG TPA: nitroreductase family deazaflavin-dependent oxidoreductase, partial [Porticoccaceae bacterium]|nr:nitroreductase family deazaflavin-dependent oxidoreductase [Porticoccaceae bacterium]